MRSSRKKNAARRHNISAGKKVTKKERCENVSKRYTHTNTHVPVWLLRYLFWPSQSLFDFRSKIVKIYFLRSMIILTLSSKFRFSLFVSFCRSTIVFDKKQNISLLMRISFIENLTKIVQKTSSVMKFKIPDVSMLCVDFSYLSCLKVFGQIWHKILGILRCMLLWIVSIVRCESSHR